MKKIDENYTEIDWNKEKLLGFLSSLYYEKLDKEIESEWFYFSDSEYKVSLNFTYERNSKMLEELEEEGKIVSKMIEEQKHYKITDKGLEELEIKI